MSSIYGFIYGSVRAQSKKKLINLICIYSITYMPNKNNILLKKICLFMVVQNDNRHRERVCSAVDFGTDGAFSCAVR